jgi:alcohol dehydrogenase/propanol-preferring alcohol dehydrogenase
MAEHKSLEGTTYKCVQIKEKGKLELVERKVPKLKSNEVLVKVSHVGLCHSDVMAVEGIMTQKFPLVPGHEVVGNVAEVGSEVKRFKVGDRVGRGWHGSHCHQCDTCVSGTFLGCPNSSITGISVDGGYSQYMVAPYEALAKCPEGIKGEEAAPLLCAGLTCWNALRKTGASSGALVAIQGIGGLGHLGLQCAVKMGFETVAISTSSAKAEEAKKLGAHHYIDTSKQNAVEELKKLGGARVIITTVLDSSSMSSLVDGLGCDGELLIAGADYRPLTITPLQLIMGPRRKVVGCFSGHAYDSQEFLKFCSITGVKSMSEVYPLAKFQEAYERMLSNKARYRVVLAPWQ